MNYCTCSKFEENKKDIKDNFIYCPFCSDELSSELRLQIVEAFLRKEINIPLPMDERKQLLMKIIEFSIEKYESGHVIKTGTDNPKKIRLNMIYEELGLDE